MIILKIYKIKLKYLAEFILLKFIILFFSTKDKFVDNYYFTTINYLFLAKLKFIHFTLNLDQLLLYYQYYYQIIKQIRNFKFVIINSYLINLNVLYHEVLIRFILFKVIIKYHLSHF